MVNRPDHVGRIREGVFARTAERTEATQDGPEPPFFSPEQIEWLQSKFGSEAQIAAIRANPADTPMWVDKTAGWADVLNHITNLAKGA